MSLLAALVLAAASARVESVSLTTLESRLAVRVVLTGTPGLVAVHREGDVARLSIMDSDLGLRFAGGRRFSWTPSDGFDPALLSATPAKLDRLEIAAGATEVSLLLHVPPDVSVDVRHDSRGLLVVFRNSGEAPERVSRATRTPEPVWPAAPAAAAAEPPPARARGGLKAAPAPSAELVPAPAPPSATATSVPAAPAPPPVEPAATPAPVGLAAPPATAQAAPSPETAEMAKQLFPSAPAQPQAAGTGSVAELYAQLFPTGAVAPPPEQPVEAPEVIEPGQDMGVALGPFRVRASVDARYVDADTFVESTAVPTRDKYLEVQPRIEGMAPVGEGRFTLDYLPVFRAFATYDQVNSSSHSLGARIDLPVGSSVTLRASDRFRSGVLDTRVVDPGGEYFYGLGHFRRNDADAGASIMVGPRLSVELGGTLGMVRFQEQSNFFDYDTRAASAGLGFEVTPNLKAIASYVYDDVPRPDQRPEAQSTAHSARFSLTGDILPLLTGELSVGYRDQSSPNAGPGGTSYSGFTMSAALARQVGREAVVALYASRSTPVSAYEENGFYVSTGVQGTLQVPMPARFQLRGGVGYQWNDYRTVAAEIGKPREDTILGWYVGLRRPVAHNLYLSGAYRSEDRTSNVDTFTTDADGFYFQLEWDIFGGRTR
jgi:Putative beta-barrel porin 2